MGAFDQACSKSWCATREPEMIVNPAAAAPCWRKELVGHAPKCKKPPLFRGDSSNVEVALRCFALCYTQVFLSDSNHLERLDILVAGAGFEPAAFRL